MLPLAPGRFSTTTGCPSRRCIASAIMRATMSGAGPAVNGTMITTGRPDGACAFACLGRARAAIVAAPPSAARRVSRRMVPSSQWWCCALLELPDLRCRAPLAESGVGEGELSLAVKNSVGDQAHTTQILEPHAVRPLKKKDPARGTGMPPRPKTPRHAMLAQQVVASHDVVSRLHLVVHV